VQLVDRVGRSLDGGGESERESGSRQVIVDGLRYADDPDASLRQLVRYVERAVASDRDQRVDPVACQRIDDVLRSIDDRDLTAPVGNVILERIAPVGRAEDGAAEVGDAADGLPVQTDESVVVQESVIAVGDAVHLPAETVGGEDDCADHRVQAGGVATSRVHRDASDLRRHGFRSSERASGRSRTPIVALGPELL